jgi:hypothetical protein
MILKFENHPNNLNTLKKDLSNQKRSNGGIVENRDLKDIILLLIIYIFYLDPPYSKADKEWNYVANVEPEELLNVLRNQGDFTSGKP